MSILTAAGWHSRAICYEDLSRDTAQSRTCRLNYYTPVNFFFVKTKEKKSEKKQLDEATVFTFLTLYKMVFQNIDKNFACKNRRLKSFCI